MGANKAVSQLAKGWRAAGQDAIEREYKFSNFEEASNFILRYTQYCHKVNANPQWFNVYNTVRVTLQNSEF